MRAVWWLFAMAPAWAQVVPLKVADGSAEIEFISGVAFRLARSWGAHDARGPKIRHDRTQAEVSRRGDTVVLTTKYLVVEVDQPDLRLRVKTLAGKPVVSETVTRPAIEFSMAPTEEFYGLGADGALNLRGQRVTAKLPFLLSSAGYGRFFRGGVKPLFDLARGRIELGQVDGFEYVFYYGPTIKEILEEHLAVVPQTESLESAALDVLAPNQLPAAATRLPSEPLTTWSALERLVRRLSHWSLSGVLYPAFDLATVRDAPAEIRERTLDLAALLPILSNGPLDRAHRAQRERLKPYLITYLREAYDRGFPLIRPFVLQFSKDPGMSRHGDVFLLGDELLLAPVFASGSKRAVDLPRGRWTDLRTNIEYAGRQRIEIDAPPGSVPILVRNGSVIPIAYRDRMELHYFPNLGGEFFLWEPDRFENTQFHASPALDYLRVEIESKVERLYEWVLHHTRTPREVLEGERRYERGVWWHDDRRNDLHIVVRAEAGADRIVNIHF